MGILGGDKRPARDPGSQGGKTSEEKAKREHEITQTGFRAGNMDDKLRGRGQAGGHYNRDDE